VHPLYQADALRLGRVQGATTKEEFGGALSTDEAGEKPSDAVLRYQPEPTECGDESC
jgi:hypothetical protein